MVASGSVQGLRAVRANKSRLSSSLQDSCQQLTFTLSTSRSGRWCDCHTPRVFCADRPVLRGGSTQSVCHVQLHTIGAPHWRKAACHTPLRQVLVQNIPLCHLWVLLYSLFGHHGICICLFLFQKDWRCSWKGWSFLIPSRKKKRVLDS